jgi:hypothetical protein
MVINVEIDILKEVAAGISNMDPVIMITDEVGVRMRYPTLDDMVYVKDSESFGDGSVELMARCIQQIFDGEQSFLTEEASLEELLEFIEDIPSNVYEKMQTFIQEMPKIKYEKEHECPKCKFQHFLKLEGMNDFFI